MKMRRIAGRWVKGRAHKNAKAFFPRKVLKDLEASKISLQRALTKAVAFEKKSTFTRLRLINYAKRAGVPVESLLRFNPITRKATFLKQGITFSGLSALQKSPKKRLIEKIIPETAKTFGRLHTIGIAHRHPHSENLVFAKGGKVQILDFKIAKLYEKINWDDPEQVFCLFCEDIKCINEAFAELGATKEQRIQFVEMIVRRYEKMPPDARKLIAEKYERAIVSGSWH